MSNTAVIISNKSVVIPEQTIVVPAKTIAPLLTKVEQIEAGDTIKVVTKSGLTVEGTVVNAGGKLGVLVNATTGQYLGLEQADLTSADVEITVTPK